MSDENERSVASTGSVAGGDSDRSKPINTARLQALEQLSAMDQELELQYGLTGNPMIKEQEHTPQTQPAPGKGTEQSKRTEPVAWLVEGCEYDTGCEFQYASLFKEGVEAAVRDNGGRIVPLYHSPTLTQEEREAVEIAVEYVGSAYQVEHHAAVLRGLLERTR